MLRGWSAAASRPSFPEPRFRAALEVQRRLRSCRLKHSDARWTAKILHWVPDEGLRNVGHPKLRWRDPLQNFAAGLTGASDTTDAWQYLLLNKEEADDALPHFLKYCKDAGEKPGSTVVFRTTHY